MQYNNNTLNSILTVIHLAQLCTCFELPGPPTGMETPARVCLLPVWQEEGGLRSSRELGVNLHSMLTQSSNRRIKKEIQRSRDFPGSRSHIEVPSARVFRVNKTGCAIPLQTGVLSLDSIGHYHRGHSLPALASCFSLTLP